MKWLVTTRVTIERLYRVDGSDAKEAEANSCDAFPISEFDVNEETMSIVPMDEAKS